eukprot:TRINITY_DN23830_c0_g1_i4.p1 TRINITY_DN23830_c0_g1~~TRINITY_DN23830_c0_g1_i4.p1  ORF type:complete len:355 (+),score=52.49 TRINITY_DN23830_c0_g1_i4:202-1266(+)
MECFSREGARIWLLPAQTKEGGRKLAWTWELIEHEGIICCANTQRPNQVAAELFRARVLPGLADWSTLQAEHSLRGHSDPLLERLEGVSRDKMSSAENLDQVDFEEEATMLEDGPPSQPVAENTVDELAKSSPKARGGATTTSRLDFKLTGPSGDHYIEVKNCHLVYPDGHGYFPDSVSKRASRHVAELQLLAERGAQATALFVVARGDIRGAVRPSEYHDPGFAIACRGAAAKGVSFRAVVVSCCLEGMTVVREAPVDLEPYDTTQVAEWAWENRLTTGWIRSMTQQRVGNMPFKHHLDKMKPTKLKHDANTLAKDRTPVRKRKSRGVEVATDSSNCKRFNLQLQPATVLLEI